MTRSEWWEDSALDTARRPPLTDDLFSPHNLRDFMGSRRTAKSLAAAVSARLARSPSSSFEAALTEEYERAPSSAVLKRAFTSLRFYLRDLLTACTNEWPRQVGGVTNYEWLVREVETWRSAVGGHVLWMTFNYDGLLDRALEDAYDHVLGAVGAPDAQLSAYVSHPDWALVKLHGSYDWRRRTSVSLPSAAASNDADLSSRTLESEWDPEAEPPDQTAVYERGIWDSDATVDRRLWIPAITAPLAGKDPI